MIGFPSKLPDTAIATTSFVASPLVSSGLKRNCISQLFSQASLRLLFPMQRFAFIANDGLVGKTGKNGFHVVPVAGGNIFFDDLRQFNFHVFLLFMFKSSESFRHQLHIQFQ